MKLFITGENLEVLVQHGKVRVIIRPKEGPSIIEESPLKELHVEETVKDLSSGGDWQKVSD